MKEVKEEAVVRMGEQALPDNSFLMMSGWYGGEYTPPRRRLREKLADFLNKIAASVR